jgi:hypothetical protein
MIPASKDSSTVATTTIRTETARRASVAAAEVLSLPMRSPAPAA